MAYINGKNVFFSPKIHLTPAVNKKPYIDTSKMTNFRGFFFKGMNKEFMNNIDTSNGVCFDDMFAEYFGNEYPQIDTSKGTSFYRMFEANMLMKTAPTIDTHNGQGMERLYVACFELETASYLDLSNANSCTSIFEACTNLKNVSFATESITSDISFADSPLLTNESIQEIVDGLAYMSDWQPTVVFNSEVIGKMTVEHFSTIASKGWNVG